jgi:hypothetical protein
MPPMARRSSPELPGALTWRARALPRCPHLLTRSPEPSHGGSMSRTEAVAEPAGDGGGGGTGGAGEVGGGALSWWAGGGGAHSRIGRRRTQKVCRRRRRTRPCWSRPEEPSPEPPMPTPSMAGRSSPAPSPGRSSRPKWGGAAHRRPE